jgi:hypothetical protein
MSMFLIVPWWNNKVLGDVDVKVAEISRGILEASLCIISFWHLIGQQNKDSYLGGKNTARFMQPSGKNQEAEPPLRGHFNWK